MIKDNLKKQQELQQIVNKKHKEHNIAQATINTAIQHNHKINQKTLEAHVKTISNLKRKNENQQQTIEAKGYRNDVQQKLLNTQSETITTIIETDKEQDKEILVFESKIHKLKGNGMF